MALGGTPGESETHAETAADAQQHPIQSLRLCRWRGNSAAGTSGCFGGELWIEIEGIVRSSCSWFERRVNLPTEEFLLEQQKDKCDSWIKRCKNDAFMETLAFQSMVLKNWCLLISSTPSGPAPTRGNTLSCQHCTRHSGKRYEQAQMSITNFFTAPNHL